MVEYKARFRGSPSSVRDARRAIVDYARLCGFDQTHTHEIALAAGEALANAVEHGTKDLGHIGIACRFEDGVLTVEVFDDGSGFDVASTVGRRRDPAAIRGFGISIMHAVMDSVEFEKSGTFVRLRKRRVATASDGVAGADEA